MIAVRFLGRKGFHPMRGIALFILIAGGIVSFAPIGVGMAAVTLDDPMDHVAQARIYISEGKPEKAERHLLTAAKAFKNAKPPRRFELGLTRALLGDVYRFQGNFGRSIGEYEAADSILVRLEESARGRNKSLVLRHRGRIANDAGLALAGLGDHQAAVTKFHKSISIKTVEFPEGDIAFAPTYGNIAASLFQTHDYRAAAGYFNKFIAIWSREHGADDADLHDAYASLAAIAEADGKITEAVQYYDRAISVLEADPDQWHALTITHLQAQRSMMLRFGFLATAEKRLRRELALRQAYQPNDATALVEGYRALGVLIREQGRPAEALPILHHALLLSRISGQASDTDLISYAHSLANGYLEDRQFDAANKAVLEMISAAESAARNEHIDISQHLIAGAAILYRTGKIQQAVAYQTRVVQLIAKSSGPTSTRLIDPLRLLADSQRALLQYDTAIATIRRALAIARHQPDISQLAMAQMMGQYGFLLTETGSVRFAEQVLNQRLKMTRDLFGTKHIEYAIALFEFSNLHGFRGQLREAISKGELALAVAKLHPDELGVRAHIMQRLGLYYWKSESYVDPEALFRQALELLEKTFSPDHPFVAELADNLVGYRFSNGRRAGIENLTKQALRIRKATFGENHEQYARSLNNLGQIYRQKGREVEAAELFREAITIYRDTAGLRWLDAAKPLSGLASIYRAHGYLSEALPLWQQAAETYKVNLGTQNRDYRLAQKEVGEIYFELGYLDEARPILASYLAYLRKAEDAVPAEVAAIEELITYINEQTSQKL